MLRKISFEAALVVLIAILMALGSYALRSKQLPLLPSDSKKADSFSEQALYKPMSMARAVELFNHHGALFVDARIPEAYAEGHIPGALNLYPGDFEQWSQTLIDKFPPEKIMITYCDGTQCPLARELAEKLTWLGFEHVYCLLDGWEVWQARHLPMESGVP